MVIVTARMSIETATAVPRSPVSVAIQVRGHALVQDKLADAGGKDEGPMASEFLLASLLACQHSTSVKIAAKRRTPWVVSKVEGAMHFDSAGDIANIDVAFSLAQGTAGTTDVAIETILRLTEKTCTISRALRVPVVVRFTRG